MDYRQNDTDPLPAGWFHERMGTVLVRTKAPEHLSFDELVVREVRSLLELGDPRPLPDLEADVRTELRFRIGQYSGRTGPTPQR